MQYAIVERKGGGNCAFERREKLIRKGTRTIFRDNYKISGRGGSCKVDVEIAPPPAVPNPEPHPCSFTTIGAHTHPHQFQSDPVQLLLSLNLIFKNTEIVRLFAADTGKAIGGWDPAWDIFRPPAPRPLMPPKLHKNERDRAARADKVGAWEFTHWSLVVPM